MNTDFKVVETTSLPIDKQISIKQQEIDTYETLLKKREEWLSKPSSRLRGTFAVVAQDTRQMRDKLAEMRQELDILYQESLVLIEN